MNNYIRLLFTLSLTTLPISIIPADKESKQSTIDKPNKPTPPVISSLPQQSVTQNHPQKISTLKPSLLGLATSIIQQELDKEASKKPIKPNPEEISYEAQLDASLKNLKASFPQDRVPKIANPKEQITSIGILGGILDSADFHALSHEGYIRKHVAAETLRVALPTADAQRAKFGHAANELARKTKERSNKNLIKRMGELVAWSDAHTIGLNEDDLNLMRTLTLENMNTCIATLILIDQKSARIRQKITAINTIDLTDGQKLQSVDNKTQPSKDDAQVNVSNSTTSSQTAVTEKATTQLTPPAPQQQQ